MLRTTAAAALKRAAVAGATAVKTSSQPLTLAIRAFSSGPTISRRSDLSARFQNPSSKFFFLAAIDFSRSYARGRIERIPFDEEVEDDEDEDGSEFDGEFMDDDDEDDDGENLFDEEEEEDEY